MNRVLSICVAGIFMLALFVPVAAAVDTGLVAYYAFDGDVLDASGNNNDGNATDVVFVDSAYGQAAKFNGSSSVVSVVPAAGSPAWGSLTISMWVKNDSPLMLSALMYASSNDMPAVMLAQMLSSTAPNGNYAAATLGMAGLCESGQPSSQVQTQTPALAKIGKWTHVLYRWGAATGVLDIFIDGVAYSTTDSAGDICSPDVWTFGFASSSGTDFYFTGEMDEVKIYNRAVTDEEAAELYGGGMPRLVAYYPFDGDATDHSGEGNDGTANDVVYVDGKAGPAAKFNGQSSRVVVDPSDSLNLTSWTIGMWFKITDVDDSFGLIRKDDNADGKYNFGVYYDKDPAKGLTGQYETCESEHDHEVRFTDGLDQDKWYYLTHVKDEETGFHGIYLNGVEVASGFWNDSGCATAETMYIGASKGGGASMDGELDEVKIFNYAMSEEQILELYDTSSPSLVAYYPFDGDADDYSGLGNDGDPTNVMYIDGKLGQAAQFSGKSFVLVPASKSLRLTSWTYSMWCRFDDINDSCGLIRKEDNDDGKYNFGLFYDKDPAKGLFSQYESCSSENDHTVRYTGGFNADEWYYLTVVKNERTGLHALYVNGVEVASDYWDDTGCASSSEPMYIGAWKAGGYRLEGALDEVKIFGRAYSDDEVAQLYEDSQPSLVAYYPFEGDANDASVFANHASATGVVYTNGVVGKAALFYPHYDGSTFMLPEMTAPPAEQLDLKNWTLTMWIKPNLDTPISTLMPLLAKGDFTNNVSNYILMLDMGNDSEQLMAVYMQCDSGLPSGAMQDYAPVEFAENEWAHVAFTKDASGKYALYWNGEVVGQGISPVVPCTVAGQPLHVGGMETGGTIMPFMGLMDELKIYKKAKSAAEIKAEFESAKPSLVAYYPFDGSANDSSGLGNNGAATNVTYVRGKLGQAAKFDGSAYVQVPGSDSLNLHSWTMGMWFKNNNTGKMAGIIRKNDNGDGKYNFGLQYHEDPLLGLSGQYETCDSENDHEVRYTDGLDQGKWYYLTYVKDEASGLHALYINGEEVAAGTWFDTGCATAETMYIGAWKDAGYRLEGEIDELKIYNKAMSEREIQDLYADSQSYLVAYYPFDGDTADYSGLGHHGMPNNVTYAEGKVGQSAVFNSKNSRVVVAPSKDLNLTSWTISLWLKNYDLNDTSGILRKDDNDDGKYNYALFFDKDPAKGLTGQYESCDSEVDHKVAITQGLVQDQWQHLVYVKNQSTGVHAIYLDGQLIDSAQVTSTGCATSETLYIGAGKLGGYSLDGEIDELKIYSRAFSDEEIQELQADSLSGLVAYYPFDGDTTDQSGHANDATVDGSVDFVPGHLGQAVSSNATGYMTAPAAVQLDTPSFTISGWVKVDEYGGIVTLASKYDIANMNVPYVFIVDTITGAGPQLMFMHYSMSLSSPQPLQVTVPFTHDPGGWWHVACTKDDNSGAYAMYVDGEQVYSGVTDIKTGVESGVPLGIGGSDAIYPMMGGLDELMIFSKAKTPAEIKTLYSGEESGLVAYYPFDGDADDHSGQSNNGDPTGITYGTGVVGQSAVFDGSSYIEVDDDPSLTLTDWTIMMWVKNEDIGNYCGLIRKDDNDQGKYNFGIMYDDDPAKGLTGQYETCASEDDHVVRYIDGFDQGEWYLLAYTKNSQTGMNALYVNGKLVDVEFSDDTGCATDEDMYIGAWRNAYYRFEGEMDELKIYNRALSGYEIQEYYKQF